MSILFADVRDIGRDILRMFWAPSIEATTAYKEAEEFKLKIEPKADVDYDWALDYARSDFDRLYAVGKEPDDKANDVIKYLGGGTGLFTLAVLTNATASTLPVLKWATPSFACAILAIFFAAMARKPNETLLPPTARTAFRYAEFKKDAKEAKGAFIGQWHAASTGMALANETKAARVNAATWMFFGAIALLSLPVFRVAFP